MKTAIYTLFCIICISCNTSDNLKKPIVITDTSTNVDSSSADVKEQSNLLFLDIEKEFLIDFKDSVFLEEEETIKKVKRFNSRVIRTDPDNKLKKSEVAIKINALDSLYSIAKNGARNQYRFGQILTGIKISYGLDDVNNRVELFFQPWFCKFEVVDFTNKNLTGSVEVVEKSKYFKYNEKNDRFVLVEEDEIVEPSTTRFKEKLGIVDKPGNQRPRSFRPGNDYSADSESSFFTFQEIKKLHDFADSVNNDYKDYLFTLEVLLHKNYAIYQPNTRNLGKPMKFKIASMFTSAGIFYESLNKFQIPDTNKGLIDSSLVITQFANLSGLCPPGCNNFQMKLE